MAKLKSDTIKEDFVIYDMIQKYFWLDSFFKVDFMKAIQKPQGRWPR